MRKSGGFLIAGVSIAVSANPAAAQENNASFSEGASIVANEIVVSARRRAESVQDVPAVVNAVTADSIEKLNLRRLEDITSVVPGLNMVGNSNGIGTVSTVRGVNFDVNAAGNNGTVEFYVNDAPTSSGSLFQSMFDIGQVEVQRGPQGTLRGRASPSGAINITMRRPDLVDVGGSANLTVNDIHGYNLNGAINIPVIADKLAVRVAGVVSNDRGSLVRSLPNPDAEYDRPQLKNDTRGIRASVAADPFDGVFKLNFMYQGVNRDAVSYDQAQSISEFQNGPEGAGFISARSRQGVPTVARRFDQTFKIYNWQAELNQWGQKLTYVGQKLTQDISTVEPFDKAGIFDDPYAPKLVTDRNRHAHPTASGIIAELSQPTRTLSSNISHEIRLQNEQRVLGLADYVVGYLNYNTRSDTIYEGFSSASASSMAPPTLRAIVFSPAHRYNRAEEQSVFGNLTLHVTDRLEIAGGLRRIWYRIDSGLKQLDFGDTPGSCSNTAPPLCGTAPVDYVLGENLTYDNPALLQSEKLSATIYSASAKYDLSDDFMAYASYGTSWRPGNVVIGTPSGSDQWNSFLRSADEKSQSYEVGFKSSWLNNRLTLNLAGFYQKFENYGYVLNQVQTLVRDPSTGVGVSTQPYRFIASVPVKVKGVEADLSFRPNSQLSFGTSVSFADGKVSNGRIPCVDANGDGQPDGSLPTNLPAYGNSLGSENFAVCPATFRSVNAPRWAGAITGEYAIPVRNDVDGYVRGLVTWKGRSIGEPGNDNDSVKAYGILNVFAGLRDAGGNWEVSLFAKNITNTFRVLNRTATPLNTNVSGYGTQFGNGYYGISVTEPREFGINFRASFGSR